MGHHWLVADNMHGERLDHGGCWVAKSPLPHVPHISMLLPHSPSPLTPKGPLTFMNVSVFAPLPSCLEKFTCIITSHLGLGLNRFTCAFRASPQAWVSRHSFFQKPRMTVLAQFQSCDPHTLTSTPLASALDTSLLHK